MSGRARVLVAAVFLSPWFVAAAPAEAVNPAPAAPGAKPPRTREEFRADRERLRHEIFDHMSAVRRWKIVEELKLDDATAARFFPLLTKHDEQERQFAKERGEVYREMWPLLRSPNPDSARVDAMVGRLLALRDRRNAVEAEKIAAARKVLTPVQMAKLLTLLPRIDEGFRQRIREAVDTGRGKGGPDGRHGFRFDK